MSLLGQGISLPVQVPLIPLSPAIVTAEAACWDWGTMRWNDYMGQNPAFNIPGQQNEQETNFVFWGTGI